MSFQNPYDNTQDFNPYTDQNRAKALPVAPLRRESSGFDLGEFSPVAGATAPTRRKSRSAKALKDYRYGQGNLCTKGGRVRCIGRICCCSLMTAVFLIVSLVLALALWIRPPSITIGAVQPLSGSGLSTTSSLLSVELAVDISVANPNYFSVDFEKIEVELFYPIKNTPVGGGITTNIDFKSNSRTNFTFPFTLSYNTSEPQANAIVSDLATRCGVTGGKKSNLNILYKISLGIRIIMITIHPVISNEFSFPCPISASDISKLLTGVGLNSL